MIEKLNTAYIQVESDSNAKLELANKINELVDGVNELQKHIDGLFCAILDLTNPDGENKVLKSIQVAPPTDPYIEQHKWIGKLCRFWDDGCISNYISLLKQIDDDDTPFVDDKGVCWQHCEPVLPTDDIIYKGGDNE